MAPPPPSPPPSQPSRNGPVSVSAGLKTGPQRIGIYGTGGVGKTTLVAALRNVGKRVLFLDADNGSANIECERIDAWSGLDSFAALRGILADSKLCAPYNVIVIDSLSKVDEWSTNHVIETVPSSSGKVQRLEDYGYGKGFQHCFEEMRKVLADLDSHIRQGRDVVTIAHSCKANVPNPGGHDFIRYEPRLQTSSTGKADFRSVWKEWLDHLFFVDYDVAVSKDERKAQGHGSRTIWCQERPTHLAKSRTLRNPIVYREGSFELWSQLFNTK